MKLTLLGKYLLSKNFIARVMRFKSYVKNKLNINEIFNCDGLLCHIDHLDLLYLLVKIFKFSIHPTDIKNLRINTF